MSTITVSILKKSVMSVVEGLSATIAQHNPDVDFSTIWASDSEEPKLDVHYREAITDLENSLSKWTLSTSTQFDLQALADDLQLTIKSLANWPKRFSGLLANQIQNYLVHAIMAGWLNDFPNVKTTDYASMGASDLDSIKEILLKKEFSFAEWNRADDAENKEDDAHVVAKCNRVGENSLKEFSEVKPITSRSSDSDSKSGSQVEATSRSTEEDVKEGGTMEAGSRSSENESRPQAEVDVDRRIHDVSGKNATSNDVSERKSEADTKERCEAGAMNRNADDRSKTLGNRTNATERHKDEVTQCFRHERVDWSGGMPPFILR